MPATTTVTDVSSTPYGAELDNVDENGQRSLVSTSTLFSMAIAPLPGVDIPADASGPRSATLDLRDIEVHYEELTPEQRAVVDKVTAPPGASTVMVPAGLRLTARDQLTDQVRAEIAAARARPKYDSSGDYLGCTLQIDTVKNDDAVDRAATINQRSSTASPRRAPRLAPHGGRWVPSWPRAAPNRQRWCSSAAIPATLAGGSGG